MNGLFPKGFRLEAVSRDHPRAAFRSGVPEVDEWLHARACQAAAKHLASTKVLLDNGDAIAGYYTLAQYAVDFSRLPPDLAKGLPKSRPLPAYIVAWLGIRADLQGQGPGGLGDRLFAQALADVWRVGQSISFTAVFVDCLNERAKRFYARFGFDEVPERPMQLCLSMARLEAMMRV